MSGVEKSNCWKVRVYTASLKSLVKELGKDDVVWRLRSNGVVLQVVVLLPRAVTKRYAERKMKSAVDVVSLSYEVFKAYKPGCRQIKFKSPERAEHDKQFYQSHTHTN